MSEGGQEPLFVLRLLGWVDDLLYALLAGPIDLTIPAECRTMLCENYTVSIIKYGALHEGQPRGRPSSLV